MLSNVDAEGIRKDLVLANSYKRPSCTTANQFLYAIHGKRHQYENKVVKGSEFETEYDNIATAIASKADSDSPTFTGTLIVDNITVGGTLTVTNFDGGTY